MTHANGTPVITFAHASAVDVWGVVSWCSRTLSATGAGVAANVTLRCTGAFSGRLAGARRAGSARI
eukprot:9818303-Heterocapsa_arctica.AAC.1